MTRSGKPPTSPARRLARLAVPAALGIAVLVMPVTATAATTARSAPARSAAAPPIPSPAAVPAASPTPPDPGAGTLSTATPTVTQGGAITFAYATSKANFNPTDWIGIYSDPGCGPVDGNYTCPSTTYQYTPTAKGALTFDTASLTPGPYIAYYLYDNEYDTLATPVTFTVAAVAPVTAPTYESTLTSRDLDDPQGVTESPGGHVYVADTDADNVTKLTVSDGRLVRTLGSRGGGNGQLRAPRGVAVDHGLVWVADTADNCVEEYTTAGTWFRTIGGPGTGKGQIESPEGVAVSGPLLYVSDDGNNRIDVFSAWTGKYVRSISGGPISSPAGMSVDDAGDVWVAMQGQTDTALDGIVELSPVGKVLLALDDDNTTTYGGFNDPTDVAVDAVGHIFVAEPDLGYIQELSPTGVFLNEFGTRGPGTVSFPTGVAVEHDGTILVADSGNDRLTMWKQS